MSCIGFLSPQQRRLLRASTSEGTLSSFSSPAITAGKIQCLREMAVSPDPKIRESAALAYGTPVDVLEQLASDPEGGVRFSVARNEHASAAVLRQLAGDEIAGVRGWVAANPNVPVAVLDSLADDPDPTVRSVVSWARSWPKPQADWD